MGWSKDYQTKTKIGQILVRKKLISEDQLARAIDYQASTGKRLGDILAEWNVITEQHVNAALRVQRNFRLAATVATALMAPLQTFAVTPAPAMQATQRLGVENQYGSLATLSEQDLEEVSAQGLDDKLLALLRRNPDRSGKVAMGDLVQLMAPMLNFLDADARMKDVVYDAGKSTAVVNADGSVSLRLPSSIGELSFHNIRPAGSEGPAFGSVTISKIELNATTITSSRH
jgi:hypothetical protein